MLCENLLREQQLWEEYKTHVGVEEKCSTILGSRRFDTRKTTESEAVLNYYVYRGVQDVNRFSGVQCRTFSLHSGHSTVIGRSENRPAPLMYDNTVINLFPTELILFEVIEPTSLPGVVYRCHNLESFIHKTIFEI